MTDGRGQRLVIAAI